MQDMLPLNRPPKQQFISPFKINQFKYETATSKRVLSFLMDENVCLKNRLSEILKNSFEKNLLEEMEIFQNKFIEVDERLESLRADVAALDKLLLTEWLEAELFMSGINNTLKNIRTNVEISETEFGKLKSAFSIYLLDNM